MKILYLSIFTILIISCSPKEKTAPFAAISNSIDSVLINTKDFSGVILVADSGKTIFHKAYGFTNFDTKEPIDTNSVFELASVSKQFTSMIIMMLQEEGKLNYDDPLEKYIPNLPYKNITIRHLLTHTSGLPDYQKVMDENWDKSKVAGNTECIEYLIKYAPAKLFEPGDKYEYSNTGYMLLASIAEKASNIDFISFARTRIFVPLKMNSTDIRSQDEKALVPSMAWGHIWNEEKNKYIRADSMMEFNYGIWLGNRKGPGRISSTSSDLLKWDQTLYEGKLVKDETLLEAFTPMKLNNDSISNYGFGWNTGRHPTMGRVVRHSGGNPGYITHIVRYVDQNRTVIMLSNNAHRDFSKVLAAIEKRM